MKIKRIFAIIAVVLLVALYGSTIVFARVFGKKESDHTDDAKDIPKK